MSLTRPEDLPVVEAACAEFLKICQAHGIEDEQVLQACIAIASASIDKESGDDKAYRAELLSRFTKALKSAVLG